MSRNPGYSRAGANGGYANGNGNYAEDIMDTRAVTAATTTDRVVSDHEDRADTVA